jgi:hypothetical protein
MVKTIRRKCYLVLHTIPFALLLLWGLLQLHSCHAFC